MAACCIGRRIGPGLLALVAACGSGGPLDGGFISAPWKPTASATFADTATTTALATDAGSEKDAPSATRAGSRRSAARSAGRATGAEGDVAPAPAAVTSGRLETALIRLRELERRHHRMTGNYSAHPARLGLSADPGMDLRVVWASPWGWAAIARDSASTVPACAMFVGTVPSTLSNDGRVGSARAGAPSCMDSGEQPSRMLTQVLTLADDPPSADQGLLSLMRSDLLNLATSQRQYRAVQGTYSRTTRVLNVHYSWTSGVGLNILSADSKGWSGSATYDQLPGKSCVIYGGKVAAVPATEEQGRTPDREGVVVCDE